MYFSTFLVKFESNFGVNFGEFWPDKVDILASSLQNFKMTSSASDTEDEFIEMKIDKGSKDANVSSFIIFG